MVAFLSLRISLSKRLSFSLILVGIELQLPDPLDPGVEREWMAGVTCSNGAPNLGYSGKKCGLEGAVMAVVGGVIDEDLKTPFSFGSSTLVGSSGALGPAW